MNWSESRKEKVARWTLLSLRSPDQLRVLFTQSRNLKKPFMVSNIFSWLHQRFLTNINQNTAFFCALFSMAFARVLLRSRSAMLPQLMEQSSFGFLRGVCAPCHSSIQINVISLRPWIGLRQSSLKSICMSFRRFGPTRLNSSLSMPTNVQLFSTSANLSLPKKLHR